jgi:hypothetical protein
MHAVGTQDISVGNSQIEALGHSDRARVSLGNLFVTKKVADQRIEVHVYTPRMNDPNRDLLQNPTGLIVMTEDEARRLALQLLLTLESAEQEPLGRHQPSEKTVKLPNTRWSYRQ